MDLPNVTIRSVFGFRVWGLGFRVWGLGFRFRVPHITHNVSTQRGLSAKRNNFALLRALIIPAYGVLGFKDFKFWVPGFDPKPYVTLNPKA